VRLVLASKLLQIQFGLQEQPQGCFVTDLVIAKHPVQVGAYLGSEGIENCIVGLQEIGGRTPYLISESRQLGLTRNVLFPFTCG